MVQGSQKGPLAILERKLGEENDVRAEFLQEDPDLRLQLME